MFSQSIKLENTKMCNQTTLIHFQHFCYISKKTCHLRITKKCFITTNVSIDVDVNLIYYLEFFSYVSFSGEWDTVARIKGTWCPSLTVDRITSLDSPCLQIYFDLYNQIDIPCSNFFQNEITSKVKALLLKRLTIEKNLDFLGFLQILLSKSQWTLWD